MVSQYLHHIFADPVLLWCSAAMLILFAVDMGGLLLGRFGSRKRKHLDFSTTIVSVGLFATFFGVLIGLYGFDSANISASVPRLLEGLRFAFAASVMGMFLSLTLSIANKFLGDSTADEHVLHSIDRKMGALVTTIESPGELVRQFTEMKGFLKEQLQHINNSLDQALVQLARGATEEVIKALEKIILEFNRNLTEQFGDNFKELNSACLKLVEWQRDYRGHIETTERSLKTIMAALDKSSAALKQIVEGNEETQKVCREVGGLIKTYDIQVKSLETHLDSLKQLGEKASQFLSTTERSINLSTANLNSFSGVIEKSVSRQSEALSQLTKDIDAQLPKALGELEKVLTNITNQFASDYRSLFQFITDKR